MTAVTNVYYESMDSSRRTRLKWSTKPDKSMRTPQQELEAALGAMADRVTLREQAVQALEKTESEWMSVDDLAKELGVPRERLLPVLNASGEVRRPVAARANEMDLFRAWSRPLTTREKLRYVLTVLSRQAR